MSDQSSRQPPPQPNGAAEPTPKRSVRDVAEAVYDDLLDSDSDDQGDGVTEPPQQSVDESGRVRDAQGRFAAKEAAEPGEADEQPKPVPAPTETPPSEATAAQPAPAQPGSSIEPPTHWSADDRSTFKELTPKGQELFRRRYSEMERDYTQKTQAAAQAVNFTQTVEPIFRNPRVAESLQAAGASPVDAINQWAQFHLGIIHPDPAVRLNTVQEIIRRAQIDPATVAPGRQGHPAIPPEALKDPATRFLADQVGKLQQEILTNRQQFQQMSQAQAERQAQEVQQQTEWHVHNAAEEVDARGAKVRPYFDRVIGEMMMLHRADPSNRDLDALYRQACRLNEAVNAEIYQTQTQAASQQATQQASNQRAAIAARSNLRGKTTPVVGPNGTGERRSLRDTLEAAADDAGIN